MAPLAATDLQALAYEMGGWCVSIYLSPAGQGPGQPERLRQAVDEARRQLEAARAGRRVSERLLRPLELLAEDPEAWREQGRARAVFRSERLLWSPHLPLNCPDLTRVDRRFCLWPLLTMLSAESHFYLLALEPDQACLLRGSPQLIDEVPLDIPGFGCEFSDGVRRDERYARAMALGDSAARSRAMVAQPERSEAEIRELFQRIDHQLVGLIGMEHAPLVLAGQPELVAIYRAVSRYPSIPDQAIVGDPLIWGLQELHAQAWAIVAPHFSAALGEALGHYRALAEEGCASTDLARIVPAARDGRVALLFVALPAGYSPAAEPCAPLAQGEPGIPALIEQAILETWLSGGRVYLLEPARMPEPDAVMAALFRG